MTNLIRRPRRPRADNTNRTDALGNPTKSNTNPSPKPDTTPLPPLLLIFAMLDSTSSTATIPFASPSLGPTGRAICIAVIVTLFLFFCIGAASYFGWRQRTRFYREKGQVARIWTCGLCGKPPSTTTDDDESRDGDQGNRNNSTNPDYRAGLRVVRASSPFPPLPGPKAALVTTTAAVRTRKDVIGKEKTATAKQFSFRCSKLYRPSSRAEKSAKDTTATMASKPCYVLKDKPLLPATVPTATPYGHADPVIRTYMDRYRRESAEQKYAQTGEYPRFIANLQALSPSVPDPSAPCQTKTASLSFSTFSDSSDSSFDVQQGDAGDARAKRRSNNKSVWGRTSNVFLGSREGQRSHISKNHVSRYFQENSRSHPFPLYAPTYNSDEEDDEDDNHDGYGEMRSRPQETVKEEAAIITQWPHHQQLLLQQQQEQEQQRQYSSDLKVEHRSPTSVKEAKAKLARMTAQAEEMKAKAAKPQGRIGGGPPTAVIPTIPTTIPPPARTNYGYNYNSVTTNNKYLSMKNPSLLPNPYLTSTSAPPAAAAAAATAIIRKQ